jgi:hypothetical protein
MNVIDLTLMPFHRSANSLKFFSRVIQATTYLIGHSRLRKQTGYILKDFLSFIFVFY